MTPQEQLLATADYIEEHGWTRGTFEYRGRCCVHGALNIVAIGEFTRVPAVKLLSKYLNIDHYRLADWNDACTHRSQVLKALRAAAKLDIVE